jgi:hypothetical protein
VLPARDGHGPRSVLVFSWGSSLDTNVQTRKKTRLAGGACLALCLVVLPIRSSWAATTPIYKCFDKNLGLLYTDEPCTDGEKLNIRAGDADPRAVARLERERDALDQSAAQRMADNRRDVVPTWIGYEPTEERGSNDYGATYVSADGFVSYPFMHQHRMRARQPKSHHMRQFAPHPPFTVPRR